MKKIGVILNNKKLTCGGMKLGKCIIDIHHVGDNNVYFPKKKRIWKNMHHRPMDKKRWSKRQGA